MGRWVHFRTQYGYHVGLIERVTNDSLIVVSPRRDIPAHLASANVSSDELQRLNLALAWWGGFGRGGYQSAGYGRGDSGVGPYGNGFDGYGG